MTALVMKELKGLGPALALILFATVTSILFVLFTERLDEIAWFEQMEHLAPGGENAFITFYALVALGVAYSLFPREHDEGTMEFLYSLPLSRRQIFSAKVLAAYIVVLLFVIGNYLTTLVLTPFNHQSFVSEQLVWQEVAKSFFLEFLFLSIIVSHGLLLSFLRRFGLVLYALVAFAVSRLVDSNPDLVYLDPATLLRFEYQGVSMIIPGFALLLHSAVALVSLGLASFLWMGRGQVFSRFYARTTSARWGRGLLVLATLATTLLAMIVMHRLIGEAGRANPEVAFDAFVPVRAETTHYSFTYSSRHRGAALPLIRASDEIFRKLRDLLESDSGPEIVADLTFSASSHLGLARGNTIRVSVHGNEEMPATRILAHESAHAFQSYLSQRKIHRYGASLELVVEGSADYIGWEIVPDEKQREARRRVAVAAWKRFAIDFEELVDAGEFRQRYDPALHYVLGELWTAALVRECGRAALGAFFTAIGRNDAAQGLTGVEIWREALQSIGCDLENVVASWSEELSARAEREKTALDRLPVVTGGFHSLEGGELVFRASVDAPRDAEIDSEDKVYFLRLRRDASSQDEDVLTLEAPMDPESREIEFRVWRAVIEDRWIELQLGQSMAGCGTPLYEEWQGALLE